MHRADLAVVQLSLICALLLAIVLTGPAAAQSNPSSPRTTKQLTIAAWVVQTANEQNGPTSTAETNTSWRNTFGRERKTARWRKLGARSIDADIIILKQLKSLNDVRRLFPARTHRLVASRAALATDDRLTQLSNDQVLQRPDITYETFPALAVRRRRGLRITAVRHVVTKLPADAASDGTNAIQYVALAARIWSSGRTLWVMTPIETATCKRSMCATAEQKKDSIQHWMKQMANGATPIIVADHAAEPAEQSTAQAARKMSRSTAKPTSSNLTNCKTSLRMNIRPAQPLPTGVLKMSKNQSSPDRPCASRVTITH